MKCEKCEGPIDAGSRVPGGTMLGGRIASMCSACWNRWTVYVHTLAEAIDLQNMRATRIYGECEATAGNGSRTGYLADVAEERRRQRVMYEASVAWLAEKQEPDHAEAH